MTDEEFYAEVGRLLGVDHAWTRPLPSSRIRRDGSVTNTYKTRWNGREPGNGRFPGRGIVRVVGSSVHVALREPSLQAVYASKKEALDAIGRAAAP
jgi:hypothetical protein